MSEHLDWGSQHTGHLGDLTLFLCAHSEHYVIGGDEDDRVAMLATGGGTPPATPKTRAVIVLDQEGNVHGKRPAHVELPKKAVPSTPGGRGKQPAVARTPVIVLPPAAPPARRTLVPARPRIGARER